ncbi:MAG: DbpA RNA binding domain-containing protein [Gaiellaceae bacterium]
MDNTQLDGEDVQNVRVLQRFSFVEVPKDLAEEVVAKVNGKRVRDVPIKVEVAGR